MSSRNFVTEMTSEGRLDAGTYKCDVKYNAPANETELTTDLYNRVSALATQYNGRLESHTTSYSGNRIYFVDVYAFLNDETMIAFAQQVGYPQRTRSIFFTPNYSSLQALL